LANHSSNRWSPADTAVAVIWLGLEAGLFAAHRFAAPADLADALTRNTVRLALAGYAAAATGMLLLRPADWRVATGPGWLTRWCWTLAWASYLVHLAVAFLIYHQGSHAAAVAHTEQVSGWGEGTYVSHFFTLVWSLDVLAWWLWPGRYASRPAWIDWSLHGFMVFMVFNATVVYETGFIRWAGLALFAWLAAVGLIRLSRSPCRPEPGAG
jgi:hypothetical protein